MLATKK
jgi:hypothetical protein